MMFEVRYSPDGGNAWTEWTPVEVSDLAEPEHTVEGLINGTEYSFQVRAVGGLPSASVEATPAGPVVDALQIEGDGPYGLGDAISPSVCMTGTVEVTGTPQLALDIGGVTRQANYDTRTLHESEGQLFTSLEFSYTVVAADSDSDGLSIAADALSLNGGTIKGIGETDAVLTIPSDHVITNDSAHTVDGSN